MYRGVIGFVEFEALNRLERKFVNYLTFSSLRWFEKFGELQGFTVSKLGVGGFKGFDGFGEFRGF